MHNPIVRQTVRLIVMATCWLGSEANGADPPSTWAVFGSPAIDGKCDKIWSATVPVAVARSVPGISKRAPQRTAWAEVRMMWDERWLYGWFDVHDGFLAAENGAPWEQDSVELLIDENHARSESYQADDVQYRINYRGQVTGGENFDSKNVNVAVEKNDHGYQVELAVRWRQSQPKNGKQIGIELQVNDDSGAGQRDGLMKWSHAADSSWSDTSAHGTVRLCKSITAAERADQEKQFQSAVNQLSKQDTVPAAVNDSHGNPTSSAAQLAELAEPPKWVADAIFYQIFPERFCNGDGNNDPTRESLEFPDVTPSSWRTTSWIGDWYARDDWEVASGDNFYEHGVFNRRYGGDLQGVIDRLDYLEDLGITAIYFNPVFYARSLHKYDGNSFHHIDPYFGPDPAGDLQLMRQESSDPATWKWSSADRLFLQLVQLARKKGIRVIIDGVFNHCGRDFFAFADLRQRQQESAYVDWFNVDSFDDPNTESSEFKYEGWWGVETLPCFADNSAGDNMHPGPKSYIFAATRRWMDPDGDGDPQDGISGWRLDVANELPDLFWREWHELVRAINPSAYTVAEIWTDARRYIGETQFTATMNYHGFAFPTTGALVDARMPMKKFAAELQGRRDQYPLATQLAMQNLMDSHDTPRIASMIVNGRIGREQNRPYLQPERFDYDVSERSSPRYWSDYDVSAPTAGDRRVQRLVTLFQMTYVGAPMVYYGTEAGMWGGDDPDDRMPMVWPDMEFADQKADPLNRPRTADPVAFDRELFRFFQAAIELRKKCAPLRRGVIQMDVDDSSQALVFRREYEGQSVYVVINRGEVAFQTAIPGSVNPSRIELLLSTEPHRESIDHYVSEDGLQLELPPVSGIAFQIQAQ